MPKLRPETAKLRAAKLVKSLSKHNGNQTEVAKELGVTKQAISDRLSNPVVKETIQETINRCLAKAGITEERVYGQLSKQLDAKETGIDENGNPIYRDDFNSQDKARKDALKLMGHSKDKVEHSVDNELGELLKQSDTSKLKELLSSLTSQL